MDARLGLLTRCVFTFLRYLTFKNQYLLQIRIGILFWLFVHFRFISGLYPEFHSRHLDIGMIIGIISIAYPQPFFVLEFYLTHRKVIPGKNNVESWPTSLAVIANILMIDPNVFISEWHGLTMYSLVTYRMFWNIVTTPFSLRRNIEIRGQAK